MKIIPLSEQSLVILFEQTLSKSIFDKVVILDQHLMALCEQQPEWIGVITERVPAYASLYLQFNTQKISSTILAERLQTLWDSICGQVSTSSAIKQHHIPVFYDQEVAPDLQQVANYHHLSVDEVIQCHSQKVYDVYAIGFAPGFAYLGILNEQLKIPRKETPRLIVPKGSVAIAEQQTSIYPNNTPGGWHIIGNSPFFVDKTDEELLRLFNVGDQVIFEPIDLSSFISLSKNEDQNTSHNPFINKVD